MANSNDWDKPFATNEIQSAEFLASIRGLVGQEWIDRPTRVLEVGSGDGSKTLRLAESWPQATFTGVDICDANIQLAERQRRACSVRDRVQFLSGDYLSLALEKYDLIFADSVLHLIPGSTDALFTKLTMELNRGGYLVMSMPFDCMYNSLLFATRRILRRLRSRLTDWLILTLARLC